MERCFERRVWTAAIEHRRSSVKANLVLSGGCLSHGSGDEKRRARNLKLRRNVSLNSLRLQFILIQTLCYCCVLLIFFHLSMACLNHHSNITLSCNPPSNYYSWSHIALSFTKCETQTQTNPFLSLLLNINYHHQFPHMTFPLTHSC